MNSPTEPSSPSPSTPSSGSPPPDEISQFTMPDTGGSRFNPVNIGPVSSPGASKRRLPGGASFAAASSMRDAKSRRREEALAGGSARRGGGSSGWTEGKESGRRDKDDLVDIPLAEQLRKEFGDPFQEGVIKNAS